MGGGRTGTNQINTGEKRPSVHRCYRLLTLPNLGREAKVFPAPVQWGFGNKGGRISQCHTAAIEMTLILFHSIYSRVPFFFLAGGDSNMFPQRRKPICGHK